MHRLWKVYGKLSTKGDNRTLIKKLNNNNYKAQDVVEFLLIPQHLVFVLIMNNLLTLLKKSRFLLKYKLSLKKGVYL